ncbi:hypothetical protein MVEN_02163200 [Mycena venus]|uniref:Uncharacterized protein n=1 Tax=Mycena venus TaxID=2733690 RepID=A0A8H6X820_9AGAR|nr:hypothetical protein MVEN_02163200 [Mycena venus]
MFLFATNVGKWQVNLSEIFLSTTLQASYPHLPTTNSGELPNMERLLENFLQYHDLRASHLAPQYPGYLGEHTSTYPAGTEQLSGPFLYRIPKRKPTGRRRHSSPYIRSQLQAPRSNTNYHEIDDFPAHRLPASAIAGPSRIPMSISAPGLSRPRDMSPTASQERRENCSLAALSEGRGISESTYAGLMEQCQICENYFLASFVISTLILDLM